jgi:histidine triad (HIT) family protein
MSDCLFCKIVAGTIPSKAIMQDDEIFAFDDIHPQAPVHTLVVPKRHIGSLSDAKDEDRLLLGKLLVVAHKIATMKNIVDSGYRVVTNTGPNAGQSVFHLHFHVLGGRPMTWPPG